MFQKTLLLAFEVIVQPPIAHFLTFSSETKIMKITHSAPPPPPQPPIPPAPGSYSIPLSGYLRPNLSPSDYGKSTHHVLNPLLPIIIE